MGKYLPPLEQARRRMTGPGALERSKSSGGGGGSAAVPARPMSGSGGLSKAEERKRLVALLLVCVFGIMYTVAYEQQGNTLQLFFDEHVDRNVGNFLMPSAWLQAINPIMILVTVFLRFARSRRPWPVKTIT